MELTSIYDRWSELSELVEQASSLPPEKVESFCIDACGEDQELYRMLRELLAHNNQIDTRLKESISTLATDLGPDKIEVGEIVGSYKIEELLGKGGMGEVYLASRADGEFEKKVAIKVVRDRIPGPAGLEMFRNERQIMANLNHPSIPTLVDAGQLDSGKPYFICDYVEGIPIDEYCSDYKLSTIDKLELLRKIGEALQHAHNNLILHLDIKPDNVLVSSNGTPNLLDFGVARLLGDSSEGQHAFSPSYASPEQIRGDSLSAASDIYSLGALMYRIFRSEAPFETKAGIPTETVLNQRAKFVERLVNDSALNDLNPDLRAIISKAMSDNPQDRYATVDGLLRDLSHFKQHLPVSARKKTPHYVVSKAVRRHRVGVVLLVTAFAVLAGFGLREQQLRKQAQAALAVAAQVSDFMTGVFRISDPNEARGKTVTAVDLLENAAASIDEDLADQPVVAGRMLRTMGRAYDGLGLYDRTTELFERALEISDATPIGDRDDKDRAELLAALANHYIKIGNHDSARSTLEASITSIEQAFGSEDVRLPPLINALGRLETLRQNYPAVEPLLSRALRVARKTYDPDNPEIAEILMNQAFYYNHTNQPEKTLPLYQESARIFEAAFGPDHRDLAWVTSAEGVYYTDIGNYDKAIETLEKAYAIRLKTVGSDHPGTAYHQQRLGIAYFYKGDYANSEKNFLLALTNRKNAHGPDHPTVGITTGWLGDLYSRTERFEQALEHFERSQNIMRAIHSEDHQDVAFAKMLSTHVLRKQGRLEEAESLAQQALASFEKLEGASNTLVPDGKWALANVYRDQGKYELAAPHYKAVFEFYQENPSPHLRDMQELTRDYRQFLVATGRSEQADALVTPTL